MCIRDRIDDSLLYKAIVKYKVGSILNTGQYTLPTSEWQKIIAKIQGAANETRMKIPVLYGVDAIHGANYTKGATLFPQELATAATFDTQFAYDCGEVTAYELRASNIPWNFSPVLDLGRQPLWSRFFETFGEDPYLATQMGDAMVNGYQGEPTENSQIDKNHVAACLKHFLGYSNSKTGKDRTPIQMSERELREYYLVPFKSAIEKGAQSVMINSTEINGTPVHANSKILIDLLKEELQFDGFAVTDWEDIIYLHTVHNVAVDQKEATKIAINAGVDMSMVPLSLSFADYLVELVNEGEVSQERINDAVRRILRVKYRLGLFDQMNTAAEDYPDFGSEKFASKALEAARESVTLLKNKESILPLSKDAKVLFTGVAANSLNALNGAWTHTWQGVAEQYNSEGRQTIFEYAQEIASNVKHVKGTSYTEEVDIKQAVKAAKSSDVIVVCLGETPATEKVGDIVDLSLPEAQINLVKALAELNKPMIGVLVESRPRVVSEIEENLDAVLMAYLPGDWGGQAIAETIFGLNNPSGKLPFTYPRYSNDLLTYDHKSSELRDKHFGLNAFNPQWEFGEGYSYTTFEYSKLAVSDTVLSDMITVSIDVTNTGDVAGKEAVLLFTKDHYASITPSVKRLRKFDKVYLEPGETKTISFELNINDVKYLAQDLNWMIDDGKMDLLIGDLKKEISIQN